MQLTDVEARVLGSLMEKESTTPEYYPLSLNALVAACNQKSSREPVMQLTEREVEHALRSLEDSNLVSVDHGSRVQRYENRARTVFQLRRDETALLCLLLLRGPQTPGELRGRADRLFQFDDVAAVLAALNRLARPAEDAAQRAEPLVAALARQPGSREQRYRQVLTPAAAEPVALLSAKPQAAAHTELLPGADMIALAEKVELLARKNDSLAAEIHELAERVRHLEEQLGVQAPTAM